MARAWTRSRTGPTFFSGCMCCVVFALTFTLHIEGVQAGSGNSSSVVTTADSSDDGETETTMEKGMRPFFDMVKSFLGVVQPNKVTEETWLNLSNIFQDGEFQTEQFEDWKDWVEYLMGFVVCGAVGVLYFLVMPIVGLIFCCCRCCGKCGARLSSQDPKHARCKRTTYGTLLIILNTFALAGVICTFLSNQILYDKLRNENNAGPTGKLIYAADQVNGFVNTTIDEIDKAVVDPFINAKNGIISDVRNAADDAIDSVLTSLNADGLLNQAKAVASDVTDTKAELSNAADKLKYLSTKGSELSRTLAEIQQNVSSACGSPPACPDTSSLAISANFSGLDDLSTETNNVAQSLNLSQYITEAEDTITAAKNETAQSVDQSVDEATESVNDVDEQIKEAVSKIKKDLTDAITDEVNKFRSNLEDSQDDISKYSKYAWYGGIGVSCALLLVVLLYYVGLLFGLCGERPGFGAQCCNTGTGANFLMAGVGFTFILGWLIMLVCIVLFVTGGPVYTELCRYFDDHDPQTLKPFSDAVMGILDLQKSLYEGKDVTLDLVDVLEGCENDGAIYSVLQLDNMVNLTQYTDLTSLHQALDDLKLKPLTISNITIVTSAMEQAIEDFGNAGLEGIQFTQYDNEVNKDLTVGNLTAVEIDLRTAASNQSLTAEAKMALQFSADQLLELQRSVVKPMESAVESLKTSLAIVKIQAESGLKNSTDQLIVELQTAEDQFNSQKSTLVSTQVNDLIDSVKARTEKLVQDILTDVNENIANCRPVFNSFYSASDSVCVVALEPLNGIWFSIGWCLFFFVPCLIFAVKLAGLYHREHEERDFDDPLQQPGQDRGVANQGYERDSYAGPVEYPTYKGGADNHGHHDNGYMRPGDKYSPPPYAAVNGNQKGRDPRSYPY